MDEKLMMMEQERQSQARKRKKTRKKLRNFGVLVLVIAAGAVWYLGWGRKTNSVEETSVQIVTSAGQKVVYADLVSVKGNEITYRVAREVTESEKTGQSETKWEGIEQSGSEEEKGRFATESKGREQSEMEQEKPGNAGMEVAGQPPYTEVPDNDEISDRGSMRGGRPNMSRTEGEETDMSGMGGPWGGRPDMSGTESEETDMSGMGGPWGGRPNMSSVMPDRGNMRGESPDMGSISDAQNTFIYDGVTYEVTDETVTTLIPVGTEVITKLGTVTTFSRLAADDKLGLVIEEENGEQIILAVYIIV